MKFYKKILIAFSVLLLSLLVLAFSSCSNKDVKDGVTYDGNIAIDCDKNATEVVLRDGTVGISTGAFAGCTSLTKITIPSSVSSILPGAFANCNALFEGQGEIKYADNWVIYASAETENVVIKDGTVGIAYEAFSNCPEIRTVYIPDSVKYIGKSAFYGANKLTDITLPFIGSNASTNKYLGFLFGALSSSYNSQYVPKSLKTVTLTNEKNVARECFAECANITTIQISNTALTIADQAFAKCTGLTAIKIPDSVTSIGDYAFTECHSLMDVEISDNVTTIPLFAFKGCISLSEITIPESVTNIEACALANCSNLTTVNLPKGLKAIGQQVFDGCNKLSTIEISSGEIGKGAFNECASLQNVTIGANVTKICDNAFFSCISLTNVTFEEGSILETIGEEAFCYCPFTELNLPENLKEIGDNTFYNCKELKYFKIPDSVTKIGNNAFFNCINLIETKGHVDYVDGWIVGAFPAITYIVIDENVRGIINSAFTKCTNLDAVYFDYTQDGTIATVSNIGILNSHFESADKYYYTESDTQDGTGWHYLNGVPTVWH